jgi:transcriptional regulator with XRE-family HTH domain
MGDVVAFPGQSPDQRASRPEPLWREQVGAVLRDVRLAADLRLVDVAERAGVSPQYLSEVERGLKDASSEILAAITGALGMRPVEIAFQAFAADRATIPSGPYTGPVCLAA